MITFDENCQACPRLANFLRDTKSKYPDYWCKPVPPFGDLNGRVMLVGLAPGMHGANASGRPFTGDHAGILLYETLYKFGFASAPVSKSADDGLTLKDLQITNAVKCLPPENKPVGAEITQCNQFLKNEIHQAKQLQVIIALGKIAHDAVVKALGLKQSACKFAHQATHELDNGLILVDSYHCSRYNTQTGRLTESMFHAVFAEVKNLIHGPSKRSSVKRPSTKR